MQIKEKCADWSMVYDSPTLKDFRSEQENQTLTSILHLAGDVVSMYSNVPEVNDSIRDNLLETLTMIFADAKDQVVNIINNAMSMHALSVPLEPEYSEANIFGLILKDKLQDCLHTKAEMAIAEEHFHTAESLGDLGDEDDVNDDDTEI